MDNKNLNVLEMNLSSPIDGTCTFAISYFTPSASWTPYYDVNVAATNEPVKIVSKAKVRQITGVDWEKLNLISGKANITYDGAYVDETSTFNLVYSVRNPKGRSMNFLRETHELHYC